MSCTPIDPVSVSPVSCPQLRAVSRWAALVESRGSVGAIGAAALAPSGGRPSMPQKSLDNVSSGENRIMKRRIYITDAESPACSEAILDLIAVTDVEALPPWIRSLGERDGQRVWEFDFGLVDYEFSSEDWVDAESAIANVVAALAPIESGRVLDYEPSLERLRGLRRTVERVLQTAEARVDGHGSLFSQR